MSDQKIPLSDSDVVQIHQQYLQMMAIETSTATYQAFVINNPLTKIELIEADQAICTFTCPTAFHATNFKKTSHDLTVSQLQQILGRRVECVYEVGMVIIQNQPSSSSVSSTPGQPLIKSTNESTDLFSPTSIKAATYDRAIVNARSSGLRLDYTFDTFAVSTTNEMAHAAASAVSQRPGTAYNPLFLYGGVGVGKTHLMHAIGNNIIQLNPDIKILYVTGEEFTNEIVSSIQNKKTLRFKDKYRTAQVLLVDDIQFIAGKNAVQEEFFHTFNALTKQSRQIVLTSDRPPHEINLLEDRLRSRFEAGLMIDIQQPTFELRTAILLIKAKNNNLDISMELAQQIASRVDSARKIEGVVTELRSAVELQNQPLNESLIEAVLKKELESSNNNERLKVSANDIIKAVSNHFHIKQTALRGERRVKEVAYARHIAMFLLQKELQMPYIEIGKWFSNRDHSTALHGVKKIETQIMTDDTLQRDVSALKMSLQAIAK